MLSVKTELLQDFKNIESVLESVKFVVNRVRLKECTSIVSMSGLGKRQYFHVFEDHLQIYADHYKILCLNATDKKEVEDVINKLEKRFIPTIVLFRFAFEEDCEAIIQRMENLREKYYTNFISVILVNLKNVYTSYVKKPQVLVKSTFIKRPLSLHDSKEILERWEEKYDLQISEQSKEKIINLSGGHTGLLKSLFLIEVDKPEFEVHMDSLLLDEGILRWLRQLLLDLPKPIMADITSNARSIESGDTLRKFGYLNERDEIFSPIVAAYLKKIIHELKPEMPVELQLSSQEKAVYDLLLSHKNTIVSRDEIAKALWGDEYLDLYSDWSIDQVMYRIRIKMKKSGSQDKVSTRKKQGFIYETVW